MPRMLGKFDKAASEIFDEGGEALLLEHVVAIGFADGRVYPRETIDNTHAIIFRGDDVLWFEIRPYNQPFAPGGFTRRATNPEWELLQAKEATP